VYITNKIQKIKASTSIHSFIHYSSSSTGSATVLPYQVVSDHTHPGIIIIWYCTYLVPYRTGTVPGLV
jgi:hypothetical protein